MPKDPIFPIVSIVCVNVEVVASLENVFAAAALLRRRRTHRADVLGGGVAPTSYPRLLPAGKA